MFPQSSICPAKVNWTLRVGPKNPSGFHRVETLMLALDLHDELHLRLNPELTKGSMDLTIQGPANSPDIPTDQGNLILRAARSVADLYPDAYSVLPSGLSFELEKRIPSQAGLGGGSSNAAAAAVCLLRALDVEWGESDLLELLQGLGSDCPFFGHVLARPHAMEGVRNSALCYDQGQLVRPQIEAAPALHLCVITPEVGCPTGAIYSALPHPRHALPMDPSAQSWGELTPARCNDLEGAALDSVPLLLPWREALTAYDGDAFQLSGSGASFYGVVPPDSNAQVWFEGLLGHLGGAGLKPRFHWHGPLGA